ncbi:MAG: hypothetical protein OER21_10740, partial [Gemmatimonadota bacterium]|nr:hypothetical protein [Gemmatimonadota bacterium]
ATARARVGWTPQVGTVNVAIHVYRARSNSFPAAVRVTPAQGLDPASGEWEDPTNYENGDLLWFWLRAESTTGDLSAAVQATPAPIEVTDLPIVGP